MAVMQIEPLKLLGVYGSRLVAGSFAPNGSSAVDSTSNRGGGFTVARTSTGLFTVTLDRGYQGLICGAAWLQQNAAARIVAHLGAADFTTAVAAPTILIRIVDVYGTTPGTPVEVDIAAHANNRVNFAFVLKRSGAGDASGL